VQDGGKRNINRRRQADGRTDNSNCRYFFFSADVAEKKEMVFVCECLPARLRLKKGCLALLLRECLRLKKAVCHGHVKVVCNLSFPQAKRVGNPSEKGQRMIPDKPE
jgi:hypothetical protein